MCISSVDVQSSSFTLVGNPAHVQPMCMYQVPPSLWWGIQHMYSQCACTRFLPHSDRESSTGKVNWGDFGRRGNLGHPSPVWWRRWAVISNLVHGLSKSYSPHLPSLRLQPIFSTIYTSGVSQVTPRYLTASVHVPGSSLTLVENPAHVQPVCMYQVPPSLWWGNYCNIAMYYMYNFRDLRSLIRIYLITCSKISINQLAMAS